MSRVVPTEPVVGHDGHPVTHRTLPSQVAVLGLGYVGLPLAQALGQRLPTLGFDVNPTRVRELQAGYDSNGPGLKSEPQPPLLSLTHAPEDLQHADFLVIAVPTPVGKAKRPDLSYLTEASRLIARGLAARNQRPGTGDRPVIVYESTVYPGCTEEVCIPVLERESGLKVGRDFSVGYSPERSNPGDPEHTLDKVVKVVSAQDPDTLELMAWVYGLVVNAGVYRAPDIRTAEAAKVIENVQRDLNIALMNEFAMLLHRMGINVGEVLKAAKTKWNFLPFEPGLVGGHCLPEDPYYLTNKAEEMGYHPKLILAGRRVNDSLNRYVAQATTELLIHAGKAVRGASILVLGTSFKENVRDVRNTQVVGLVQEMASHGCRVAVYDPVVGEEGVKGLGLPVARDPFDDGATHDAVILAVPHRVFLHRGTAAFVNLVENGDGNGVLVDVRGALPWETEGSPSVRYWSLLAGERAPTQKALHGRAPAAIMGAGD